MYIFEDEMNFRIADKYVSEMFRLEEVQIEE